MHAARYKPCCEDESPANTHGPVPSLFKCAFMIAGGTPETVTVRMEDAKQRLTREGKMDIVGLHNTSK